MKVLKLEDILNESNEQPGNKSNVGASNESEDSDDSEVDVAKQKSKYQVPSGRPKSKRIWKNKKTRSKFVEPNVKLEIRMLEMTTPISTSEEMCLSEVRDEMRFSSIVKTPGIRLSKEKKDKLRQELKHVKEHSRALLEDRKKEKEEKRMRRQENLKRQQENQRKSEIVQVIKNTAKIKRMKKKHLRKIEKRDTTMLKQ